MEKEKTIPERAGVEGEKKRGSEMTHYLGCHISEKNYEWIQKKRKEQGVKVGFLINQIIDEKIRDELKENAEKVLKDLV